MSQIRKQAVPRPVVDALHDLMIALSEAINEFSDPIDKAALRDALQLVLDVTLEHDVAGQYGVFADLQEEVAA
jgi:hypothetical protein